jgi:hypothetical protein
VIVRTAFTIFTESESYVTTESQSVGCTRWGIPGLYESRYATHRAANLTEEKYHVNIFEFPTAYEYHKYIENVS